MGSGLDLAGRRSDGSEFPIEAGLSHITIDGEVVVLTTITDISKRKEVELNLERRVEERTREIERRQRISDELRDILAILNSNRPVNDILHYIARRARLLLHAQASAICCTQEGDDPFHVQVMDELPMTEFEQLGKFLETNSVDQVLLLHLPHSDSATAPHFQVQLAVPLFVQHKVCGILGLYYGEARQFSDEEIALVRMVGDQTALAIENARLRMQVERAAVAAERNRIARDLHDAVTQTLFSASMIAEVMPRLWERNPEEGKRRLHELRELTLGALAEMRTLLLELRPARLMEVDLADLLRQLVEATSGRARVPITLHAQSESNLPPDVKVAFYRIAQEALNNIAKHARAQHAIVTFTGSPQGASLSVRDDGCGFVTGTILPQHLGLSIMRERADAIHATLTVKSLPDQGTEVSVSWRPMA
jgi:signal transduction histidine kinase